MHLMFGPGLSGDAWLAPVASSAVYTEPNTWVHLIFYIWLCSVLGDRRASVQNISGDSC